MRKILFILLLISSGLNAQTFSFQCICDYLTAADANCDICNTNIQSRLFKGILIRKDGTAFKWIDQPYIVQFQGNNATFKELIPNGETITITLAGTPFDSIPQYQDSIKCPCAGSENFFVAGPGIYFSGDTISAIDTSFTNELQYVDSLYVSGDSLYISLYLDSIPAIGVPLPTGSVSISAGTGISVTGTGTLVDPYLITNTSPHVGTDLSYTGTSSPVTLNSSTGTDVTITAGTGISLAGTSSDLTITNTGLTASGTTNYLPKWITSGTTLSSTSNVYDDGARIGIRTASPTAALNVFSPIDTPGIKLNYTYKIGNSASAISVLNQDALETFALGANRTANEGIITLRSPSVQGAGVGINFSSNNGATARSGLFQLDNSGNMIFRQSQSSMFYDYYDNVYFRDNTFTTRMQLYNQYLNVGTTFSSAARLIVKGPGATSSTASISAINSASTQLFYVRDDGNVGVSTASPAQTLHVQGTARITGSDGTATAVMGRDGDGDISALSLSGMSISSGTLTATDGSTTNELQTLANTSDATSHTVTLSNSGGSFQLVEGSGVTLTTTGTSGDGVVTIAATGAGTDLTFSGASSPVTLNSSTGTDVTLTAGTGISLSASSSNTTITNSAPDQTVSITNGGGVSVSGTYPNFTLTATDASATNEAQTLSVSGTTSGILSLNAISGVGGGTATIAAGTGITVGQSGGTITITNSSPASGGWLLDGNTITTAKRIGSNDNFDVVVETNNTDRMWFDNTGPVSIGTTQLTTAALNISGLQNNIGLHVAGGTSLTGPVMLQTRGNGSGSTCTVLDAQHSFLNGNVEALIQNTSTTGTGGSLITLNTHQSATGDPKVFWTTNGTTNWTAGIDNSVSGEPFKITANSDLGGATPAISSTTANKVGVNQAAAVVTLQVTGTDAIGLPTGTTAQRSAAAIPQIRHNNTFSGLEFYDQNKNYWYRLTAVSTPSATSNTAAGTGHSGSILSGSLSSDVRGTLELNTGTSTTTGTVMTVTYASAYSGTKTVVTLTPANDQAATDIAKWRIDTQSQTGFTIRAVSPLTASSTYTFNYYVGQ